MHRQTLLSLLQQYAAQHPDEQECVQRITKFVQQHPDCFLRSCVPGHITASAWILSHDRQQFLLTQHRKLQRWLQLGGHVDGEARVERAALREAQEESGMAGISLAQTLPLDLDVHEIPAHGPEPAHLHYDVRFLLLAPAGASLQISAESLDLSWFSMAELETLPQVKAEWSLLRMGRKAALLNSLAKGIEDPGAAGGEFPRQRM